MKTAAILLIALFSSVAQAADDSLCESRNELATIMMTKRQEGHQLKAMMARINNLKTGPGEESDVKFIQAMLIDAFSTPAYRTGEYKNRAINDFANKYYAACLLSNK